jgi:HK97 family phage major capsid protein
MLSPGTWGQELAPYGIVSELLEILRPQVVVDRLAPFARRIPFRTRTPRETSVAAAAWVGEKAPIPARAAAFDLVTQEAYRCSAIVVLSLDLARFSNPSAEIALRSQLTKGIARFLDSQFLNPSVSPVQGARPGAVTYGADSVNSTGTTGAQKLADFQSMVATLVDANVPMAAPHFIMPPSTAIAIAATLSSAGSPMFPDIRGDGGSLIGIPVITSNSVPVGQITLLDAAEILLSDDGGANIEATGESAMQMLDNPATGATVLVSLWQKNLFALKAGREIAWQMAHYAGSPPGPLGVAYMQVAY